MSICKYIGCLGQNQSEKAIERGNEMIERDLNIIKIVKNLRDIKIHLRAKGIMTKFTKLKAQNSGNNVILLDSESEIENHSSS